MAGQVGLASSNSSAAGLTPRRARRDGGVRALPLPQVRGAKLGSREYSPGRGILRGPSLYYAPYRRKEAWVEENHRRKAKPGPVLGLAGVTTLAGVMLFALAIHRVSHSVWSKATIAFLMGVVALIIAGRLYAAWLSLRQGGGDRGPDS